LDFRIDWGYQMLYSRRQYHPIYRWDGHLECSENVPLRVSALDYPPSWWGPCLSPTETPLDKPEWQCATRRKVAGIRVRTECGENAGFKLVTLSGSFAFSAKDIVEKGHLVFPVGPKFGFCTVTVCRTGHLWFRPAPVPGQNVFDAADLPLKQVHSHRMALAVLPPGAAVELPVRLPMSESRESLTECLLHVQAMILDPVVFRNFRPRSIRKRAPNPPT